MPLAHRLKRSGSNIGFIKIRVVYQKAIVYIEEGRNGRVSRYFIVIYPDIDNCYALNIFVTGANLEFYARKIDGSSGGYVPFIQKRGLNGGCRQRFPDTDLIAIVVIGKNGRVFT